MNTKIKIGSIAIVLSMIVLSACTTNPPQSVPSTAIPEPAKMVNPATANCEEKGYRSKIITTTDGSQYGVCIFPDRSECEEWAFFRGQCAPASGATTTPDNSEIANPATINCEKKGGKVEIHTAADGSQSGVCVFPNGKECDEWALFKRECNP